jgi:diketogulonate reductase-like aldo/keto reductase
VKSESPSAGSPSWSRRAFLGAATLAALALPRWSFAENPAVGERVIPSSGERIPVVGLGTWITFNVGDDADGQSRSTAVLRAFLEGGGRLVDSSPMYGSSQVVLGKALAALPRDLRTRLFAADKIWTSWGLRGRSQAEASREAWGVERFALLQVHNLLNWESHLETLRALKAEGAIRYLGITTSEGRRHDEFETVMRKEALDFVQLTYNALDREAEAKLLPLARERGMAVVVNRPFRQGELIVRTAGRPLPAWADEIGCRSWAQILLKFALSHPAVTCVIPATSNPAHVRENLEAGIGAPLDEAARARIARVVEAL